MFSLPYMRQLSSIHSKQRFLDINETNDEIDEVTISFCNIGAKLGVNVLNLREAGYDI